MFWAEKYANSQSIYNRSHVIPWLTHSLYRNQVVLISYFRIINGWVIFWRLNRTINDFGWKFVLCWNCQELSYFYTINITEYMIQIGYSSKYFCKMLNAMLHNVNTKSLTCLIFSPLSTTSSVTSMIQANRSTEAPSYMVSNMPKRKRDNGISPARWKFYNGGNVRGAMAIILLHLWCEKGQVKTIFPQFSLTVLFTQSRFVSTVRFSFFFWVFLRTRPGRTCCLLATVCLCSCHHLSNPALSMTEHTSLKTSSQELHKKNCVVWTGLKRCSE